MAVLLFSFPIASFALLLTRLSDITRDRYFASMAGNCQHAKVAERDFACPWAFSLAPGAIHFIIPLNDQTICHIITFGKKTERADTLYELSSIGCF